MKSWVLVEHGKDLQEIEFPTPDPTGEEILVEVTHCGVCHSDLHFWEGFYELGGGKRLYMKDRGRTLPQVIGHEVSGRVAKLGPDASGAKVGDQVIVYPWIGCGTCDQCRAGIDNMCLAPRGIGTARPGGYGSHVVVPHGRYLIPTGKVDPAVAATYTCSGITVYSAIQKILPRPPEEAIVIVGAGGLGLNALSILQALGHKNIVVADISERNRATALSRGATAAVDASGEDGVARLKEACGGAVWSILDLVNGEATAKAGYDALRKGGKMVQVGLFGGDLTVELPFLTMRAITVQGSLTGTLQDLKDVMALGNEGLLPALPVDLVPKDDVNNALHRLRDGKVTGRLILAS